MNAEAATLEAASDHAPAQAAVFQIDMFLLADPVSVTLMLPMFHISKPNPINFLQQIRLRTLFKEIYLLANVQE